MRVMQVICQGIPINYDDVGDGQVLLFVHGWGDNHKTWKQLIAQFSKNFRCIAIDLPNFGNSGRSMALTSLESISDVIAEFTEKLGLGSYTYVGHSMGGQIGIFAVGSGVLRPQKLIIVAGAGIRGEQPLRNAVFKVAAKVTKPLVPRKLKSKLYRRAGSDYDPSLDQEKKALIQAVLTKDVRLEAGMIGVPTLLLYGEQDQATPVRYGRAFHELIDGSEFKQIADADHWLHQTRADLVATYIQEFLRV